MPTLNGTEASLSYVQCFLHLVSSSINVSIFHITWLDTFCTYIFIYIYIYLYIDILYIHKVLCYCLSPPGFPEALVESIMAGPSCQRVYMAVLFCGCCLFVLTEPGETGQLW